MADEQDDWQPVDTGRSAQPADDWQSKDDWQPVGEQGQSPNHDPAQPETTALGAGVREFARNVIPSAVGGIAGLGTGIALSEATPFVSVPAAFAVGGAAAAATRKLQDNITKSIGLDSDESQARDVAQHPIASTVGGVASAAVTFNPTSLEANLSQRLLGGGIMGGVNAGQQLVEKGSIDPTEVAINAAGGAALGKPYEYAENAGIKGAMAVGARPRSRWVAPDVEAAIGGEKQPAAEPARPGSPAAEAQQEAPPAAPPAQPPPPEEAEPGGFNLNIPQGGVNIGVNPAEQAGEVQRPTVRMPAETERTPGEEAIATSQERSAPLARDLRNPGLAENSARPLEDQLRDSVEAETSRARGENLDDWKPVSENFGGRGVDGQNENTYKGQFDRDQVQKMLQANQGKLADIEHTLSDPAEKQRQAGTGMFEHLETQANSLRDEIKAQTDFLRNKVPEAGQKLNDQVADLFPAKEAPKPQSLSGGATEGPISYAPGELAKVKSGLRDSLKKVTDVWNRWFNPEALSEDTKAYGLGIRGTQSEIKQLRQQTDEAREEFDQKMASTSPADRMDALRNFQNGVIDKNNPIHGIAAPLFKQEQRYQDRLSKWDPDGNWQQRWLPNLFADPQAAKEQMRAWTDSPAEGGQGRDVRSITIGDFLDAGHQLSPELRFKHDGSVNFPAVLQKINNSRDRFLMFKEGTTKGIDNGVISTVQRSGDRELEGVTINGGKVYAQPDIAMMHDRFFDPQAKDPAAKNTVDAIQKLKNLGTAWQLLGGTYHMVAETVETMAGEVMRAYANAAAGRFGAAGKNLLWAPLSPIRNARSSATEALKAYFDPEHADPEVVKAVNWLIKGGLTQGRVASFTPDLNTAGRNFWDAWGKAAKKGDWAPAQQELKEKAARFKEAPVNEALRTFGETMQTMMHPMFDVYIPRLKIAAALHQMQDFMAANEHASPAQLMETAKRINKSVDDRLGELNQSTLFWNRGFQTIANLAFISPGWEVGDIRSLIAGTASLIRHPSSLSYSSKYYNPNSGMALAFISTNILIGAAYEFLKTGKVTFTEPINPTRGLVRQLLFPQTGGKGGKEEVILPGYLKDVYSWYRMAAGHEALPKAVGRSLYDKLSLVPHTAWDTIANENWAGKQIYNPSAPTMTKLKQYFDYIKDEIGTPIALQSAEKKEKDSNITLPERLVGIRKAPTIWKGQVQRNNDRQREADTFNAKQKQKYNNYAEGGVVKQPGNNATDKDTTAIDQPTFAEQNVDYDNPAAKAKALSPDDRGHMTDEFKLPNHRTFSTGSRYNGVNGQQGGTWDPLPYKSDDPNDKPYMFTPGKTNLETSTPQQLGDYFNKVEPNSLLKLPSIADPDKTKP